MITAMPEEVAEVSCAVGGVAHHFCCSFISFSSNECTTGAMTMIKDVSQSNAQMPATKVKTRRVRRPN